MMLGCAPVLSAADQGACFSRLVAAIDIGHSRASPGANDVFGRHELDYNFELAVRTEDQLKRAGIGHVVVVNRNLDMTFLPERPEKAFCSGADIFISIHHDSVDEKLKTVVEDRGQQLRYNDRVEGYTVYFSSQNAYALLSKSLSLNLAETLLAAGVVPATAYRDIIADGLRQPVDSELNVFDFPKLKVSQASPIPAILIEAGFMSNRNDIKRLRDSEYQSRIAHGIVQGIKATCMKHPEIAGLNKAITGREGRCGRGRAD
jgi:N-acetylmuramoyl-L-alanine amidase